MHSIYSMQLLILLFLTIIIKSPVCHGQTNLDQLANCSATIKCGSLQNIGYPFWGVNRASYCGNGTEYELTCVSGTSLEMTLSGLKYRVLDYESSTRAVTVARDDYYTNICPEYLHNVTGTSPFLYSDATVPNNLTLYYNCSTSVPITSGGDSFTCSGYNGSTSLTGYFVTDKTGFAPAPVDQASSLDSCANNVVLPVLLTGLLAIQTSATEASVAAALKEGFGLVWPDDDGACQGCTQSSGQCGTDSNNAFACYCSDNSYSSTCPISSLSPSSSPSGLGGGEP